MPIRRALPLLATAACAFTAAASVARAGALSEVRIVQVELAPNGSFVEIGDPLVVRSFSNGVVQTDSDFLGIGFGIAPGGQDRQTWDFAYTVSMRADGLPFPSDASSRACVPLSVPACSPPLDGRSLAWAFLTIGDVNSRSWPPFAEFNGGQRFQFELHEGSFQQSGLVHLDAGSSSEFASPWNGFFAVGAVTFAAAIPEPTTYAQMFVGLGLLAGVLIRRGRLRGFYRMNTRRPYPFGATSATIDSAG